MSCVGGGGLLSSSGCPPISCIRPHTKGARTFSGVDPPPPRRSGVLPPSPPLPTCRALGAHAAQGVLFGRLVDSRCPPVLAFCPLGAHAAQGVSHPFLPPSVSGGSPPPALACRALGAHAALRVGLSLPPDAARVPKVRAVYPKLPCLPVSGGSPPPARACPVLGAHAAIQGVPPLALAWAVRRGCAWSVSPLSCSRGAGAGSPRTFPEPCPPGRSRGGELRISPPCPCCAPLRHAAGWGVPLISPHLLAT